MKINRRNFVNLIGGGTLLASSGAFGLSPKNSTQKKRLVVIGVPFGYLKDYFRPKEYGRKMDSPYLNILEKHKGEISVFSGMSHPGSPEGHSSGPYMFTGANHSLGNTVSVDQKAAMSIGHLSRFPFINLKISKGKNLYSGSLAYNSTGTRLPAIADINLFFDKLFKPLSKEEILAEENKIVLQKSYLKNILSQKESLKQTLGDRQSVDLYLDSYTKMEKQLHLKQYWLNKTAPSVPKGFEIDKDAETSYEVKVKTFFDLVFQAIKTDSSRVFNISLEQDGDSTHGTHALTHSCGNPALKKVLREREEIHFKTLNSFFTQLKSVSENGTSLFDNTSIVLVGGMSSSSAHRSNDLPVLLAGGGFKHLAYVNMIEGSSKKTIDDYPLNNLYISLLDKMGVEGVSVFGKHGKEKVRGLA